MSASQYPSYQFSPAWTRTPLREPLNPCDAARMRDIAGYLEYLRSSLNLPGNTDTPLPDKGGASILLNTVNNAVDQLKASIAKRGVAGAEAADSGWDAPAPRLGEPWTKDLGQDMQRWLKQKLANNQLGYQHPANLEAALITIGALGEATLKRVSQSLAAAT